MPREVALTFDYDAMSVWIGSYGSGSSGALSRGEFGLIGVGRILKLLEKYEIPGTFFVPGHTALAFPDSVREIFAAGHEIGHHGYVHERIGGLEPEREREVLELGFEALDSVAGVRPRGYRSPSWEFTPATPGLLQDFDFVYDSSLMATDFTFFWPRSGDEAPVDGPYVFGDEVPIVEAPVSWSLDDFPHFEYVSKGAGPANLKSPAQVFDVWWAEFEFFAELPDADCFTLTMHPQVIGRGSRLAMLERFIQSIKDAGDFKFTRLGDATELWKLGQDGVPKGDRR
ncbi:MAG TPA: polysaccharide deacetylase [Solirubrobacterales bacterium]|jgi:peptidoglycan/xylan/chitin deacetylase (PgdA/CDA1 family)|nr:polysaccharide deacetylase [Solirubrobacterales bacterium]